MLESADPLDLEFTGERYVPGKAPNDFLVAEHLSRYEFARSFATGSPALDVGCGTGFGTQILSEAVPTVIGCDISLDALRYANSNFKESNLQFVQMDCLNLGFAAEYFGLVTCFEVIEHIEQHEMLLASISRILRKDGHLIISTPERNRYNKFKSRPNPYHVAELTEDEFFKLLFAHFSKVRLYWQNADPLVFEMNRLQLRVRRLETRIALLAEFKKNPLKYFWNLLRGRQTVSPSHPNPQIIKSHHFHFETASTPDSIFMVAVCSN